MEGNFKDLFLAPLVYIGLTRKLENGTYFIPFHVAPKWIWKEWRAIRATALFYGPFYLFRNKRGIIKWLPHRPLPRRWGFGIYGLFEFGDRGQ